MSTTTRPTTKTAAVYVSHRMGVACPDCCQSGYEGEALRHSSLCDYLPKRSEVARVGAPVGGSQSKGDSPKADYRRRKALDTARARIRDGVASDDDLREAATGSLRGLVSDSEAMNQDT